MLISVDMSIYETKKDIWILSMQWTHTNGFIEHKRHQDKSIEACLKKAQKEILKCQK